MRKGRMLLTYKQLTEILKLPKGVQIYGIANHFDCDIDGACKIYIEGDGLPEVIEGTKVPAVVPITDKKGKITGFEWEDL